MNRTQIIRNQAKLPGGKKSPKAIEYPTADEIFTAGPCKADLEAEKQVIAARQNIRDSEWDFLDE